MVNLARRALGGAGWRVSYSPRLLGNVYQHACLYFFLRKSYAMLICSKSSTYLI